MGLAVVENDHDLLEMVFIYNSGPSLSSSRTSKSHPTPDIHPHIAASSTPLAYISTARFRYPIRLSTSRFLCLRAFGAGRLHVLHLQDVLEVMQVNSALKQVVEGYRE